MSSNTSKYACPKCGNPNTNVERITNGFCYCQDCQHRWNIGESQPKPTLFTRITASPEVLAERSVYAHECCRIPDGATSPFIDEIFWFDDEKGDTWDERFDSAWKKAIAATVAKLKEAIN